MKVGPETVRGSVLSARAMPGTQSRPEAEQITLLLDNGGVSER